MRGACGGFSSAGSPASVCEELPAVLCTCTGMAYPMDAPVIDLTATDSEGSADDSDSDVILE